MATAMPGSVGLNREDGVPAADRHTGFPRRPSSQILPPGGERALAGGEGRLAAHQTSRGILLKRQS